MNLVNLKYHFDQLNLLNQIFQLYLKYLKFQMLHYLLMNLMYHENQNHHLHKRLK